MPALICGSMAYDNIMVFRGRFQDHILLTRSSQSGVVQAGASSGEIDIRPTHGMDCCVPADPISGRVTKPGGNRGIGLATCRSLRHHGLEVILTARRLADGSFAPVTADGESLKIISRSVDEPELLTAP